MSHTYIVESNYNEIYHIINIIISIIIINLLLLLLAFFDIKKHKFLVKYSIKWTVTSKQVFAFAFAFVFFFFQFFDIHFWQKKKIPEK